MPSAATHTPPPVAAGFAPDAPGEVGGGAGGGYDVYFRTFARYLVKHIPGNPNIVPKNMPAASGLAAGSACSRGSTGSSPDR